MGSWEFDSLLSPRLKLYLRQKEKLNVLALLCLLQESACPS